MQTGYISNVLFVVFWRTEKFSDYLVVNNGLSVRMNNASLHSTYQRIVFADLFVVSTIELAMTSIETVEVQYANSTWGK